MITVALFAAVMMAQAADAPPVGASAAPAKPAMSSGRQALADDEKVVCKTVERVGTRFTKKDCHTKAEWRDLTRQSQDLTNNITTQHQTASPLNGG